MDEARWVIWGSKGNLEYSFNNPGSGEYLWGFPFDLLSPINRGDSLGTDKRRCLGVAKPRYPYPPHSMWAGLGVIVPPIRFPYVMISNQRGRRR
ncbi:MAG: hypothetical protein ACP6IP_10310 [Candidatus Njordarchaeia archaeon]